MRTLIRDAHNQFAVVGEQLNRNRRRAMRLQHTKAVEHSAAAVFEKLHQQKMEMRGVAQQRGSVTISAVGRARCRFHAVVKLDFGTRACAIVKKSTREDRKKSVLIHHDMTAIISDMFVESRIRNSVHHFFRRRTP